MSSSLELLQMAWHGHTRFQTGRLRTGETPLRLLSLHRHAAQGQQAQASLLSLACVIVPWGPKCVPRQKPSSSLCLAAPGTPHQVLEVHPGWWHKDELRLVFYG